MAEGEAAADLAFASYAIALADGGAARDSLSLGTQLKSGCRARTPSCLTLHGCTQAALSAPRTQSAAEAGLPTASASANSPSTDWGELEAAFEGNLPGLVVQELDSGENCSAEALPALQMYSPRRRSCSHPHGGNRPFEAAEQVYMKYRT